MKNLIAEDVSSSRFYFLTEGIRVRSHKHTCTVNTTRFLILQFQFHRIIITTEVGVERWRSISNSSFAVFNGRLHKFSSLCAFA